MALDRPLDGIRVLDLSRLLPGPWCSLLLADMGAEVIKVETPLAGDYARIAPPELRFGRVFEAVNRGKRSIAVNYRLPRGRDIVLRLARDADVFLASSSPGSWSVAVSVPTTSMRRTRGWSTARSPATARMARTATARAGIPDGELAELVSAGIIAGPATPEDRARAARLGTALARLAERHRSSQSDPQPQAAGADRAP